MIPLWLKITYTIMTVIVVIFYYAQYGLRNFLWFSDIALLATVPALWLESSLLASMMAVGVLLPEAVWNASFFGQLLTGKHQGGLTDYMFDAQKEPLHLRLLSLFHVVLPPLLVWMIYRLGYAEDALPAQTALAWIVLPLSYWLTDPKENVNWVFGLGSRTRRLMPPRVYVFALMIALPLCVYLPTHLLLRALFG